MRVVEPEQHHEHGNKKLQDGGNTDADRELHSQRRSTYQMAQTDINNKCENTYNWNYAKMACEITVGSSLKDISFVNSDIIAALESNSTKLYQTDTSRRIMTIGCEEETKQLHGADENCFLIQYTGIRILKISTGQLIDGTLLERTRRFWPVTGNRKEWPPSLRTSRAEAECMNCFLIQNAGISILKIKTGQLVRWHTVGDNEEILASHMNSATEKMFDKWKPAILRSINESSFMAASETGPVKLCDFGKSNKPISTIPVLDRINAVEDVGLSNVCVIADSKVLLMDSTLGKKKMSIDMKPNEKCVGVLSGNAKAPCFMVLKDENKKDIMI
ncbi:hypothetical protein GCK72_005044 [Caenorhabditis remanei]|uniref:Uncharacterized protein n=1 Tax=Caenorhabditis remanei TaxID=31234 RepID=A0A6A5HG02_CAERE|nr:hypothetical protein GCK72_005044 [Caenorhabditis remanei]KAF1765092.1 hypothetical protein GCK72_005044 [Caenorhabditis remanei]